MNYRYDNRKDFDLKEACRDYDFLVRPSFWECSNDVLLEVWNGIGAEGEWSNMFIPETVWGLNISLASLPHDLEFKLGKTKRDYHISNLNFLFNMNQVVREESDNVFIKNLRFLRTNKYYMSVESDLGWEAFAKDKPLIIGADYIR